MGHTASHAGFPVEASRSPARPRGGSRRSGVITALTSALFVSGLFLWLWPQDSAALWLHLLGGVLLLALLGPWLLQHVSAGLGKSQRRRFTQLSWALLAVWVALVGTGLAMAIPAALYFAGLVWFPTREISELMSLVHFWASWIGIVGLVLHLGLRHWVWGPK